MAPASKKPYAKKTTLDEEARLVKELADILDQAGLAELEYKTETLAIRLSRFTSAAPVPAVQPVAAAAATSVPAKGGDTEADTLGNPADHADTVKSPMVGTVYTAPEPAHPPLLKKGKTSPKARPFLSSRR